MLSAGGLVAIPTETVYGLAADATNGEAVAGIFAAKGRPSFNPLICHVSDLEMAERLGRFDVVSRTLAETFWPGPLTIIVSLSDGSPVHPLATAGLDSVGLRCPQGASQAIIAALTKPLAAPSANTSGKISPTLAQHVADDLGERIDLIVDDGACTVGLESTIVKCVDGAVHILRPGAITQQDLEQATGGKVVGPQDGVDTIEAPGQMASHYAPGASMRLNVVDVRPDDALLDFGATHLGCDVPRDRYRNLSPNGDLREAASNLFGYMIELDIELQRVIGAQQDAVIAVAPIPETGLGLAINDRLRRAAAPRPKNQDQ